MALSQNIIPERLRETSGAIRRWLDGRKPIVALTLGSGLGGFGKDLPEMIEAPYSKFELPSCQAKGHAGLLRYAEVTPHQGALIFDGRAHVYEGHSFHDVVLGVRAACQVGVKTHIITCASGGLRDEYVPGELVLIDDHLNQMGGTPLEGYNSDEFGPRFPDMTYAYDRDLLQIATTIGQELEIGLKRGVYAAMRGPNYETPAEVRALKVIGADMVGMSTVPEVLALNHMGASVLGISCVANYAAGLTKHPLSHDDVVAAISAEVPRFKRLLTGIIQQLPPAQ